jgi:hypothetical protein
MTGTKHRTNGLHLEQAIYSFQIAIFSGFVSFVRFCQVVHQMLQRGTNNGLVSCLQA